MQGIGRGKKRSKGTVEIKQARPGKNRGVLFFLVFMIKIEV